MASNNFESNKLLLKWASKIDSSLHVKHVTELRILRIMNKFQSACCTEECVQVGSCVEGSKVNVPGDLGDIDVLLMSGKVTMKEELFEYVPGYPAFLCIPVINEHRQYFRNANLVERKYLPVCILKDIHQNLFQAIKAIVRMISSPHTYTRESMLRYTKESAVGVELRVLEGIGLSDLGVRRKKREKKFGHDFCELGNLIDGAIGIVAEASTGKHKNRTPDFKILEFDKMESLRRKNTGEDLGSSLFNTFNSIRDKYKQINKYEKVSARDDENNTCIDVTRDDEEHQCVYVSTPLSTLRVSQIADDELDIRFENNLDVVEQFEEDATVNNEDTYTRKHACFEYAQDDSMPDKASTNDQRKGSNDPLNDPGIPLEASNIFSIDFVPALKVDGWPKVAEEWITRDRNWPSVKVIDNICKTGCQVVAKDLPHTTSKENVKHFRLSFAMSEVILANNLNDNQKLVWRILKAYQKAYLSSDPKVLSSYHWKNVIFWICEKATDEFWRTGNVLQAVEESLDFMIKCLIEKFLPQYFVRSMNLITDCDCDTIELVKETVIAIREEPVRRLKMFIRKPPSPRTCFITFDEIQQVQDSYEKKENVTSDFLNMSLELIKGMSDDQNECRFIDGSKDFANEVKYMCMEDNVGNGMKNDPETDLFLQMNDMFYHTADMFDPRKAGAIDSAKHMEKISNVIDSFSSMILNSEKSHTSTDSLQEKRKKNKNTTK